MSYKLAVLAARPVAYFTLSGATGDIDISGVGTGYVSAYSDHARSPWVVGMTHGRVNGGIYDNEKGMFQPGKEAQTFNIEFWTRPQETDFVPVLIATDGVTAGVKYYRDRFRMFATGTDGKTYFADFYAPDTDQLYHVNASWSNYVLSLIVNGVASQRVSAPADFVFATPTTTDILCTGHMSNLAFYTSAPNEIDIALRYSAGLRGHSWQHACESAEGVFFDTTTEGIVAVMDEYISGPEDWASGQGRNLTNTPDGMLTLIEEPDLDFYAYGIEATPTYASSKLDLTVAGTPHAIREGAQSSISVVSGAIAGTFALDSTPAGDEYLWTMLDQETNTGLSLKINSSGVPVLSQSFESSDGITSTDDYVFDDALASSGDYNVVLIFSAGRVSLHCGTGINQIGGLDWLEISVPLSTATLILGSDRDLSAGAVARVGSVYLFNYLPEESVWSANYELLMDIELATCKYTLDSTHGLTAQQFGKWTYTTAVGYDGDFAGTFADFGMYSDYPNTYIELDYADSGFPALIEKHKKIPLIPSGGIFGAGDVNGPIDVTVYFSSEASSDWRPVLEYIRLYISQSKDNNAVNSSALLELLHNNQAVVPEKTTPSQAGNRSGIAFFSFGEIRIASDVNRTVEFSVNPYAGMSAVELLCARDDIGQAERNISVSGLALTSTGMSAVYLNGALVTGAIDLVPFSYNHIVAVCAGDVNSRIHMNAHYDEASYVSNVVNYFGVACYDSALTADQALKNYNAFLGASTAEVEEESIISVAENTAPLAYSYAWQTTGASR